MERSEDGVGTTTSAKDTTRKECVRSVSKAKVRAKAQANEIVRLASRRAAFQGNAPASKRARARARDSKDNVTLAVKLVIPNESARRAKKEES